MNLFGIWQLNDTVKMDIIIKKDGREVGKAAGHAAAVSIRRSISEKGSANIILATGTSQFETLNQLISEPGIDWSNVVMFHLDEYIGCLLYTSPSPRDRQKSRMPSSA